MHQYLLLRDNKKSGPYSADDLRQLGLKSYDLIWQEGKSAAWRYPGELEELKSFAPPVEEQPFDRFYRKPEKTVPASPRTTPVPAEPVQEIHKGHIVVTMPASVAAKRKEIEKIPEEPVYKRQTYFTPEPAVQSESVSPIIPSSPLPAEPAHPAPAYATPVVARKKAPVFALVMALILIAGLAMLYVNYTVQNNKIKQLRDIVTQMQQNQVSPSDPNRQLVHYKVEPGPESFKPADSGFALNTSIASAEKKVLKKEPVRSKISNKSLITPAIDSSVVAINSEPPAAESRIEKRVSVKRDDDANLMELVKVKTNDYKTGLLGGINNLKLTLYNKSLLVLKKVEVQIDYLGPESRIVKSQQVYFENVAPGADLILDVPKSNRGVKVNCTVKKIIS